MILRPESSLIPSVLALSSFFVDNFPHIAWYPYWYLGNPFAYLIGPVVPGIMAVLHSILRLPGATMNMEYLLIIFMSTVIGGVGVYWMVAEWGNIDQISKIKNQSIKDSNIAAVIAGLLYVVLPFGWMGLYYQNGLKNVAFAIIPFVFILYRRFLLSQNLKVPPAFIAWD